MTDEILSLQDKIKSPICFSLCSEDARMCMPNAPSKKSTGEVNYCTQCYDICAGNTVEKQDIGAIYDIDTYAEAYRKDLLTANKAIIIASPVISGPEVEELIQLLKSLQEKGVQIRIVTWKPDSYGFGDSAYWMELQERMRSNGFEMNLVEDCCQHYCIVDREVVWYGSMNFLGKEDSEDNLIHYIEERAMNIANYIIENNATVRQTVKEFGISKSTVVTK